MPILLLVVYQTEMEIFMQVKVKYRLFNTLRECLYHSFNRTFPWHKQHCRLLWRLRTCNFYQLHVIVPFSGCSI